MAEEEGCLIAFGFFIGAGILALILGLCGVLDGEADRLDLNKDSLARYHVLKYYPEYSNCSMEYVYDLKRDCRTCPVTNGVQIFCEDKKDKDGMRILREKNPTIEIEFKDIDFKDILGDILEEYR